MGTNYLEFCHAVSERVGTDVQEFLAGLQTVMARQCPTFSLGVCLPRSVRGVLVSLRVTRFDETEGGRVVIAHEDISEIKRAEDALRHQQEALHQSEKLAALSGLWPAWRTNSTIPWPPSWCNRTCSGSRPWTSDMTEMVTEIHQAAVRCERIVRNFLTLARPNTPEHTRVQLNDVVQEALHCCGILQLDEIEVVQQLADDLPVFWGDPHQLHQVVVNLLTNAHQALRETPPPHQIILTTHTPRRGRRCGLRCWTPGQVSRRHSRPASLSHGCDQTSRGRHRTGVVAVPEYYCWS